MSFSINEITVAGNVTRDPELTYTNSGTAILKFSVATNHSVKEADGSYKDIPTFHNIVVWAKRAEALEKVLRKGLACIVKGRQENRTYDKPDGSKGYASNIVADTVLVPNVRGNSAAPSDGFSSEGSAPQSRPTDAPQEEVDISDIPF